MIMVKQSYSNVGILIHNQEFHSPWPNRMGMARMKTESQNSRMIFWPYLALHGHTNNSKTKQSFGSVGTLFHKNFTHLAQQNRDGQNEGREPK